MKCFYHRAVDAVGTCKSCNKGVCGDCAADVGRGLACAGQCEDDVRRLNHLVERNMRMAPVNEQIVGRHPRTVLVAATFAVAAGIIFMFVGFALRGAGHVGIVSIGVLVFLFGVWQLVLGWRLKKTAESRPMGREAA
jgi:hypothetical protein